MPSIENRLARLGLVLPPPIKVPPEVVLPFQFVRSGHGPQNADGSIAEPLGKVGRDLTLEQGYAGRTTRGIAPLSARSRTQPILSAHTTRSCHDFRLRRRCHG